MVEEALKLGNQEFLNTYGRNKPGMNDEIIFSCLLGGRAQKGANIAVSNGFMK